MQMKSNLVSMHVKNLLINNLEGFASAAAAASYLKRSCSHLVKEKGGILFTESYFFSVLEIQYLKNKNSLFFLHCSR
jgi:hypothetical protein